MTASSFLALFLSLSPSLARFPPPSAFTLINSKLSLQLDSYGGLIALKSVDGSSALRSPSVASQCKLWFHITAAVKGDPIAIGLRQLSYDGGAHGAPIVLSNSTTNVTIRWASLPLDARGRRETPVSSHSTTDGNARTGVSGTIGEGRGDSLTDRNAHKPSTDGGDHRASDETFRNARKVSTGDRTLDAVAALAVNVTLQVTLDADADVAQFLISVDTAD